MHVERELAAYPLEKDLVAAVCEATPALFAADLGSDNFRVFTEVPISASGVRIPDVVLVYQLTPAPQPVRVLSSYEAAVLSYLATHPGSTPESVAEGMYCQPKNVAAVIKSLTRKGLVHGEMDSLRGDVAALTGDTRIIAIEAKLTRWREAIAQAEQYFVFAHRSFIAMPTAVAQRPDVIAQCAAAGVGVLAVDNLRAVDCLLTSREHAPMTGQYLRLVSTTTAPASQRGARRASFVGGLLPSAH